MMLGTIVMQDRRWNQCSKNKITQRARVCTEDSVQDNYPMEVKADPKLIKTGDCNLLTNASIHAMLLGMLPSLPPLSAK